MNRKNMKPSLVMAYDFIAITLGIMLYVSAWAIFLAPNNLIGGGVSGICAMIYYATGISMGLSNIIINSILLIIAFFVLGKGFGFKTIYAIILASVGFAVLPAVFSNGPLGEFVREFSANNGKMLCVIMGGAMTGIGIGLTFTHGGSTGGTDIISLMINKYRNISPGRLLLMMDVVIIGSSVLFPSYLPDGSLQPISDKIAVIVYALVLVAVNSYAVDLYLTGSKQSVQVFIFSKNVGELADEIAFGMDRGVTLLRSKGWFSKQESEVIMVVARKSDLNLLLSHVKAVDPNAFISVTSAMGVYGLGFDSIKQNSKKSDFRPTKNTNL